MLSAVSDCLVFRGSFTLILIFCLNRENQGLVRSIRRIASKTAERALLVVPVSNCFIVDLVLSRNRFGFH